MAIAAASALGGMLVHGDRVVEVQLGSWFTVGHYSFEWNLLADRPSVPFALFVALTGVIGAFSRRYLHREAGFFRFYLLLARCSAPASNWWCSAAASTCCSSAGSWSD
ncbi:MAG: hypothetical protein R3F29_10425 [Planctomycetota bacterium]